MELIEPREVIVVRGNECTLIRNLSEEMAGTFEKNTLKTNPERTLSVSTEG